MRPVPVRASFSRGSASRRRHNFVAVPVAKVPQVPATASEKN